MFCDFSTTTHGKWILAGEHAVLRGHGALVFPIATRQFTLAYRATAEQLTIDDTGYNDSDMGALFFRVLACGCAFLQKPFEAITGRFSLCNTITAGAGLGASAALCVAVARWFAAQYALETQEMVELAKTLEDLFHGKSSGVDIAGVAASRPVFFKNGAFTPLALSWKPHWYLSFCGSIGKTSDCIAKVNQLWQSQPVLAKALDEHMGEAVSACIHALATPHPEALLQLANAMNHAQHCFEQWGLVNEALQTHMHELLDEGALAVKPTGSGAGGYVLSLWKEPKQSLPPEWIVL